MLKAQNLINSELVEHNLENTEKLNTTVSQFLYGETEVPFISFFKTAFVLGMFDDLGDLQSLKEKNTLYASYIDRWVSDCVRFELIKILENGKIKVCFDLKDFPEEVRFNKYRVVIERSRNVVEKVAQIASEQLNSKKSNDFASNNIFILKDHPRIISEAKKLYQEFYEKMQYLVSESNQRDCEDSQNIKYLTLSSCTLNKEVLHDL